MKKYFNFAFLSAIALAGTFGLTACSSSDDLAAETNPNYNPDTKEVAVDFVMNVATGNGEGTRMSAANTQADITQAFRGIDNATLMSFTKKTAGSGDTYTLNDGQHIWAATTANKTYNLGTIMGAGTIDPDGTGSTPKSRRVIELALPTETNTLMFWGKAIKTGTSNQQGSITWNVDKNLANTSFTLNRRIPTGSVAGGEDAFKQTERVMAAVLNKIVQTTCAYDVTYGGTNYTGTIKWSDYVSISGTNITVKTEDPADAPNAMCPLGEILGNAFKNLNTIYSNEVRAGSGPSVAAMMYDLNGAIKNVASSTPTSKAEAIARAVAGAIQTNIQGAFTTDVIGWKDLSIVKTFSGISAADMTLVTGDINEFPKNFNVPNGAATLGYTVSTNTYVYNEAIPTYAMDGTAGGSFNIFNYRYPAELCYFGNSPLRASNTPHETSAYPDGVDNWVNNASWSSDWVNNTHVLSSSRSVAMRDNINYGTALLKTTVRYGAATLYDNNANIQHDRQGATEANQEITAAAGTFTLTGVLIGGVEETMGWNYISKAAEPGFNSFIYDNDLPSQAIPAYTAAGEKSTPNYTLVWDNWNPKNKNTKQNIVYVALEFVNNSGKDFWGMNNLIRNGATFYITGKMDPDSGITPEPTTYPSGSNITWPTAAAPYALPPYEDNGSTTQGTRIFIQDYLTEANFVIGANSLQSAIVAVPDLRSSQISLGLSVDLQWRTGLNFESIVLGE